MTDLAFLICVEHGRLENEASLLVESIRRWAGRAAEAPIYAFSPRPDFQPGQATVDRLGELGVTHVTESLVPELPGGLPTFNKVFVAAWAERELDHETLVFTDTDTVVLGEPKALLGGDWVTAARPVDRRIAGSRGKGKNDPFWRRMYEALGVTSEPFIETAVGGMRIRAYWNSGLLAARRSAGLFDAWERGLKTLYDRDIVYHRMPQFMDQLSWAAVTADYHERMLTLPPSYNYPLRQRGGLEEEARDLDLAEIVHLHYRLFFHLPEPLAAVSPPFDPGSEQYAWLDGRLPIEPLVDEA